MAERLTEQVGTADATIARLRARFGERVSTSEARRVNECLVARALNPGKIVRV